MSKRNFSNLVDVLLNETLEKHQKVCFIVLVVIEFNHSSKYFHFVLSFLFGCVNRRKGVLVINIISNSKAFHFIIIFFCICLHK